MTDSTLNRFLMRGTNAARLAYTPDPPTPASGPGYLLIWYETDTGLLFLWDGSAWDPFTGGGIIDFIDLGDVPASYAGAAFKNPRVNAAETALEFGGGRTLLSEQSPSGVNIVTFSSIPDEFRDLEIVVRGRGSDANAANAQVTFNNDTGANYEFTRVGTTTGSTTSAAESAGQSFMGGLVVPGTTDQANVPGVSRMTIFDYRGTAFYKAIQATTSFVISSADRNVNLYGGRWASLTAINEIDITLSAGNFVAGSVVSLYGLF